MGVGGHGLFCVTDNQRTLLPSQLWGPFSKPINGRTEGYLCHHDRWIGMGEIFDRLGVVGQGQESDYDSFRSWDDDYHHEWLALVMSGLKQSEGVNSGGVMAQIELSWPQSRCMRSGSYCLPNQLWAQRSWNSLQVSLFLTPRLWLSFGSQKGFPPCETGAERSSPKDPWPYGIG